MGEDAIIVAIVFGSILGMIAIPMLISLAKKWVDRNNTPYDQETFERLAKAFMKFKKDAENRIQNLEAIIADEDLSSSSQKKIEEKKSTIEIEDKEERKSESDNDSLNNMLRE